MKIYCFDLDGTICEEKPKGSPHTDYAIVKPCKDVIDRVNKLYDEGNIIIISTARHMVTTNGNVLKIEERVGKITRDWLKKYGVKYHELQFGKTFADYYIDDKAVDINKFTNEWSL